MAKDTNPKSAGTADGTSTQEKTSRSKIGRSNETIRDFLMSSQRYEADAIRVLLLAVSRDESISKLAFEDQTVINRYLIDGLYKGECDNVDSMKAYRQDRAAELMGAVGEYLDTRQQNIAVTKFLMKFSSDNVLAQKAMNSLISRPADMKATAVTTPADSSASQQAQMSNGAQPAQPNAYQNGGKQ